MDDKSKKTVNSFSQLPGQTQGQTGGAMSRQCVKDLKVGDVITEYYLVKSKRVKESRTKKVFLDIDFMDRTGLINGKVWDNAEHFSTLFERGDVVKVKADVVEYQGSRQFRVQQIRKATDADRPPLEELMRSSADIEGQMKYLRDRIEAMTDPGLKKLMLAFFDDAEFVKLFSRSAAARNVHHAFIGGLVEHTVHVLKISDHAATLYPSVNPDLVAAGAILHDAGKVRELDSVAEVGYTADGYMIGHISLGYIMLHERAAKIPELDPRTLLELEHIILSHHGEREFGSPVVPMTAEAMIVNHADNLDAKTEICLASIAEDPNDAEQFTQYHRLLNRHFYKGTKKE
jgi:3'-5' exoribonuclease